MEDTRCDIGKKMDEYLHRIESIIDSNETIDCKILDDMVWAMTKSGRKYWSNHLRKCDGCFDYCHRKAYEAICASFKSNKI